MKTYLSVTRKGVYGVVWVLLLIIPRPASGNLESARALVLTENFDHAITEYALLLVRDSSNVSLNAEFAYALALDGIYDAALARLDKIWPMKAGNTDAVFYAAQVFALMGYDRLVPDIGQGAGQNQSPEWIASKAPHLLQKYRRIVSRPDQFNRNELVDAFNRANKLTARNFTLQSIALFEDITYRYPGAYLPYLGYSIALEKAGLYEKSVQVINTALIVVGNKTEQNETRQVLEKRLASLQDKSGTTAGSGSSGLSMGTPEKTSLQRMAYAGGFVSSGYSSFNARFGQFFTQNNYATVDMGISVANNSTFTNLGFTLFNRQKIFVLGFGFTGSFGEGSSVLYSKISIGPSFMNKKGTASFDIFLDGKAPLKKGYPTTMGISIGRSIYFGKRKQNP
jgi:hypothetical protein